jgi:hypothetical protein
MSFRLFSRASIETPCTIDIEHTHEAFHAHVVLDGDIAIGPGDSVRVHGAPIRVAFGETHHERRLATVKQAGALRRLWTRVTARFLFTELYEVSFTPGRAL